MSNQVGPGRLGLLVLLTLLWALPACPPASGPSPGDLSGQVDRFMHDLRWKYNDTAANRVDPKFSAAFHDKLEDLSKELNITAYNVRRVVFSDEVDEKTGKKNKLATLKVHLSYYLMPSTVMREENVDQVWVELDGRWFMRSMQGGPVPFPPPEELERDEKKGRPLEPAPALEGMQPKDLGEDSPDEQG